MPVIIIDEKPIRVDSLAINFAVKTEDMDSGIIDKTRICKLNIPSEYFGKISFTKNGNKAIDTTVIIVDPKITKMLIFL